MLWDLFISHAGEDKTEVARPLTEVLTAAGLRVWLDENELHLGDSLRARIDHGLAHSRFGIVVLSPSFFAKHWPQQELNGLAALESSSRKVVLPVWHGVDHEFVARFSPTLADRVAVSTTKGIAAVSAEILKAVSRGDAEGVPPALSAATTASKHRYPDWLDDLRIRHGSLRVTPILPTRCQQDEFRFVTIREYELILNKPGSWHDSIPISLSRLRDPLFAGVGQPVTLVLDGRLQWLSGNREWKAFPEAPTTAQERLIGFPKFSSTKDPRIQELSGRLARYGHSVGFVREDRLGEVFSQGKQVVYDDDGLYFRWQGRDTAQILVSSGP
jgi:hypothetical protein